MISLQGLIWGNHKNLFNNKQIYFLHVTVLTASSSDISFMSLLLDIPETDTEACTSVLLIDDDIAEGTQAFSVSIQSVSVSVLFNSSEALVIEILDDDCEYWFYYTVYAP